MLSDNLSLLFQAVNEKPKYKITNTRERLHFPTWPFDANNVTDDIEVFITSLDDNVTIAELYEVKQENDTETYTCPIGYIFKGI